MVRRSKIAKVQVENLSFKIEKVVDVYSPHIHLAAFELYPIPNIGEQTKWVSKCIYSVKSTELHSTHKKALEELFDSVMTYADCKEDSDILARLKKAIENA